MDYLCNCKSETGNVCNPVEDHCLRARKIEHHHVNGRFDQLISGHQSLNPEKNRTIPTKALSFSKVRARF